MRQNVVFIGHQKPIKIKFKSRAMLCHRMRYRWCTVRSSSSTTTLLWLSSSPRMNSKLDFNCRKHVPLHNYGPIPRHSADSHTDRTDSMEQLHLHNYLSRRDEETNCMAVKLLGSPFFWSLGIVLSWAPFSFSYI